MSTAAPLASLELHGTVRAEVAAASRVVAPLWPIGTFIAVNPLGGLQGSSFKDAVRTARRDMGARGYAALDDSRAAYASGAITEAQLAGALADTIDGLGELPTVAGVPASRLLVSDLLHGAAGPRTERIRTAAARCDAVLGTAIAAQTDELVSAWCSAFTDEGGASWGMPREPGGLYTTFRAFGADDLRLRRLAGGGVRERLGALPEDPAAAIDATLRLLGVSHAHRADELCAQLLRQPGWAGYLRWRSDWAAADSSAPRADMTDLLALRLTCEALGVSAARERSGVAPELPGAARAPLAAVDEDARLTVACAALGIDPGALPAADRGLALATLARLGEDDRLAVWLAARERAYRERLLRALGPGRAAATPPGSGRPAVQAAFCIDVRSEGLRRHLEELGDYETLGFAGFFAVAIRFRGLGSSAPAALCPVLLSPAVDVEELPAASAEVQAERALDRRSGSVAFAAALHQAKGGMASPFAMAEAGGLVAGPLAALRTFGTRRRGARGPGAGPPTTVTATAHEPGDPGFTTDEQVLFAHAALTMMGLTGTFARLVLLCAHGSTTQNNPYASALDCGACGGQHGGPNARVAAAILNRPDVRTALVDRGIVIDDDTWFVAGEHDTTSDAVTLLDGELVPAGHRDDLATLQADLDRAGAALASERGALLPGSVPAAARGRDWAQVRPEWGLVGNAAFIIGPRSMTRGIDLGCRTFLHSYRTEADPDGSALETILTAPLVVAQWINAQYYFSSVDPELFGAGDKTLHNVTGTVGVVQGGGGDLRVGLPWQSVAVGDRLQHEPLRLLAVVQARRARIDEIVARNQVLRELFEGGWVTLTARDDDAAPWFLRGRDGRWTQHQREEAAA